MRLFAKRHDFGAFPAGLRRQPLEMLVFGRKNSNSALLEPFEDFCLCVSDVRERVEEFHMNRSNPGDNGNIGTDEACQRHNLARVVHADFENAVGYGFRHSRQRKRYAPEIVVGFFGSVREAGPRKHEAQHFLCAGFANAACHRGDARLRSCPRGFAKRIQRLERIRHPEQRAARGSIVAVLDDGSRCAVPEGGFYIFMPVCAFSSYRHEEMARLKRAAVDGNTACDPGGWERGAGCG